MLGRLLGSVLHQMSTPLGAIVLRAEALTREAESQGSVALEKRLRYAKAVSEEGQRCQDLVAALRDFAAPGEPGSPCDLVLLCHQAVALLRHEAMRRQVALVLDAEPALWVAGQREHLGQAILALLLNALDASSHGGRVRAEVVRQGEVAVVTVEDEGEGVPAQLALFEPFASSRPADRGLGLGLMAVRAVAEAHGGSVAHEHGSLRGSRFLLRIPAVG
jgi:signal transduction histidine kinase